MCARIQKARITGPESRDEHRSDSTINFCRGTQSRAPQDTTNSARSARAQARIRVQENEPRTAMERDLPLMPVTWPLRETEQRLTLHFPSGTGAAQRNPAPSARVSRAAARAAPARWSQPRPSARRHRHPAAPRAVRSTAAAATTDEREAAPGAGDCGI